MFSGIIEKYDDRHIERINNTIFKKGEKKAMIDLQISEPLEGTNKRIALALKNSFDSCL